MYACAHLTKFQYPRVCAPRLLSIKVKVARANE